MAEEGFELYHIPQQSRREKLRVVTTAGNCLGDQTSFISATTTTTATTTDHYATSSIIDEDQSNFLYTHHQDTDLSFIQHHHQQPLALSLSSHNPTHHSTSYGDMMLLGPYTGYASILKGSKFLNPAKQLLDEICGVGSFGVVDCGLMMMDMDPPDPPSLQNLRTSVVDDPNCRKRSRLISLLDEVYKRYKHYYQQIQAVIASFETVAGLSSAAPFANLDLKAMSKNFRCLNNAITDQIQVSVKPHEHQISYGKEELVWSGSPNNELYGQRAINNMGFVDHHLPLWRPQRGLPKRAVNVLRAWLFDHFLHPYPTDADKQILAKQTGLSRNQVSNWFINARVRVWKPMVEEVHTLEVQQVHKRSLLIQEIQEQEASASHRSDQDPPSKRPRNDFPSDYKYNDGHIMERNKEHMNIYGNFSIHGPSNGGDGNRGVSLTLGLHQNDNAIAFPEPFPLNSERFVIGGLDPQNRQVGQQIIHGQFLHDFGG